MLTVALSEQTGGFMPGINKTGVVNVTNNDKLNAEVGLSDSSAVVMCDDSALPLDERMHRAGMLSVSEMLERTAMDKFHEHAGVTDLESFEQWIQTARESFIKMQARMTLDNQENDELYEWVVAHNAVLGSVMVNFRKATGRGT